MLCLPSACARRASLALLAVTAALPAARATPTPPAPAEGPCPDGETWFDDPKVTHLNFQNSTVVNNTLHLEGGELRYEGIGIVNDRNVSLVVTDTSGLYKNIVDVWADYNPPHVNDNGKHREFGNINLQTVRGDPDSGKGNFKMCIVDTETGEPTVAEKFMFTIYDIDQRGPNPAFTDVNHEYVRERAIFSTLNATMYELWPDPTGSEVAVSCEDGSAAPCDPNVRWVFDSTTFGGGNDNPDAPSNATDQQLRRSVAVTFHDTDCFSFEYDHFCPVDQPGYTGNATVCDGHRNGYNGGYFLFGGESERLITNGTCIAVVPTFSPTAVPSTRPSNSPSSSPTGMPSPAPSVDPSTSPSTVPSASPSLVPSNSPSENPSASPSSMPTGPPSENPSASPSSVPTGSPSENPSASPSSMPTDSPSENPSASLSSVPTGSPSENPSASLSSMPTGSPSENPSASQSSVPTGSPSENPSASLSSMPTGSPSGGSPSGNPSASLSSVPTGSPSENPSAFQSSTPTDFPSMHSSAGPSLKPSVVPTFPRSVMPSAHPSYLPSDAPSALLSCAYAACCFDCFCCGPGTSWSEAAGICVLNTTSVTGDDDGQCGEADEEVCYPGSECKAGGCCGMGTELISNPNYPLADRCYCHNEN